MNRTEFLDTLRSQLSGQMHEGKVAAHVRYYEDYIQSQVRSGRDEQQVLDELGDPRLIARTLLDTDVDNGQLDYEEYSTYSDDSTEYPELQPESCTCMAVCTWISQTSGRGDPADSRLFAVSYSGGSDSVFCGTGVDFVYCVTDKKSELT